MVRSVGRPAKASARLNKQIIVEKALELLDEKGEAGVTFRALARELDVTAMAVKHHVGSSLGLMTSLVDFVYEKAMELETPIVDLPSFKARMELYCSNVLAHPNLLLAVFADTRYYTQVMHNLTEDIRAGLRVIGVRESDVPTLLNLLVDYTNGFALSAAAAMKSENADQLARPVPTIDDYLRMLDFLLARFIELPEAANTEAPQECS
ncbi:hypothetical protein PUV47_18175 [Pseudovibrio exalbescens]|uniref:TetR/AcrR family transcriptional regulator n=1 Tax=Pseudovibrio exalbescens TaxID=197461 RepID=UPI00236686A1|nr:hypothetical protein [Pseudovibrio exalbescens]MDD7911864.1 hypothetical protein [Pseudovibrio exalbescens]